VVEIIDGEDTIDRWLALNWVFWPTCLCITLPIYRYIEPPTDISLPPFHRLTGWFVALNGDFYWQVKESFVSTISRTLYALLLDLPT